MSLQLAAQHLASRGRGPDTTLVHMAPQEVAGLQALAKAHGGTLTTNPDTGLPEAGFLSSILPMVVGAGLSMIPGVGPMMAAGIVGGGTALATGSLQKGLMAGLGAYGGAGLAGGLTAAGAAGAAEAGAAGLGATESAMASLGTGPSGALLDPSLVAPVESSFSLGAAPKGALTAGAMGTTPVVAPSIYNPVTSGQLAAGVPLVETATAMPAIRAPIDPTFSGNAAKAMQGFQNLGTEAGREAFMSKAGVGGMKGLMQYGLAGLAPVAMDMMTPKQQEIAEQEKLKPYMYAYEPGRAADPQQGYTGAFTGERTYFNPVYTRTAAGGGLMDIGPVEAMSRSNQSQMAPAYAQGGVSDMAVNPYTGAETFAEGGDTKAVRRVEDDPYYTMSGQSGDAFKYLMGQMPAAPRAAAPAVIQPTSVAGGVMQALAGPTASDATVRPYTFDPVTGAFTAMPVVRPIAPAFGVGFGTGFGGDYSGGYGGDSGGASSSGATAGGGGMSNSGEGGGGPGEGGWARGGIASLAQGGQSHLGDYSDGGRLLRGPGDGVSDDIPATIGDKRPARLADGEFVVPARIVSELGNGSTEAGARKLYAMMDRVQKARAKTTGKDRVATNTKAEKLLPA